MKGATDRSALLFATSFSWWLEGLHSAFQPASAGLPEDREARLKPAQVLAM